MPVLMFATGTVIWEERSLWIDKLCKRREPDTVPQLGHNVSKQTLLVTHVVRTTHFLVSVSQSSVPGGGLLVLPSHHGRRC